MAKLPDTVTLFWGRSPVATDIIVSCAARGSLSVGGDASVVLDDRTVRV